MHMMTEMSSGTLEAAVPWTHGCDSACAAVTRARWSTISSFCRMSLADAEILGHGGCERSYLLRRISLKIWVSVGPQKGGCPQSRMYMMTPMDHTSAGGP